MQIHLIHPVGERCQLGSPFNVAQTLVLATNEGPEIPVLADFVPLVIAVSESGCIHIREADRVRTMVVPATFAYISGSAIGGARGQRPGRLGAAIAKVAAITG